MGFLARRDCTDCNGRGAVRLNDKVTVCPCVVLAEARQRSRPVDQQQFTVDVKGDHEDGRREHWQKQLGVMREALARAQAKADEAVRPFKAEDRRLAEVERRSSGKINELHRMELGSQDTILNLQSNIRQITTEVDQAAQATELATSKLAQFVQSMTTSVSSSCGEKDLHWATFAASRVKYRHVNYELMMPGILSNLTQAIDALDEKRVALILLTEKVEVEEKARLKAVEEAAKLEADNAPLVNEIAKLVASHDRIYRHHEPKIRRAGRRVHRLEYLLGEKSAEQIAAEAHGCAGPGEGCDAPSCQCCPADDVKVETKEEVVQE